MCCWRCKSERRRVSASRFAKSEAGKACDRRSSAKPQRKLKAAAWVEAHLEAVRGYKRKYRIKHRVPVLVRCAAAPCSNTFIRSGKRGAKMFCDPCAEAFYGPAYGKRRKAA